MLDRVKIINHKGESITTATDGIFINENELRDYNWSFTTNGWKISNISKALKERQMPMLIACGSEEEGIETRNRIFELVEADLIAKKPTKIYIGDYYLSGYVVESSKEDYIRHKKVMTLKLKYAPTYPFWIKEETKQFEPMGSGISSFSDVDFLDYPFDYPFDFTAQEIGERTWTIDHYADSNYKMIVYGPAVNPRVLINGYPYQVFTTLANGEYMVINSIENTENSVIKVGIDGTETNLYNARQFEPTIFNKIPSGELSISWNGEFGFDITVYKERSEPEWL